MPMSQLLGLGHVGHGRTTKISTPPSEIPWYDEWLETNMEVKSRKELLLVTCRMQSNDTEIFHCCVLMVR